MKIREWLGEISYTLQQGSLDAEVSEVVYDSRKAGPGAVFICMKGTRRDSHDFIPQVTEAGVRVLVTEHPVEVSSQVTVIVVGNGREALARLSAARFGNPSRKLLMIGVTGTKGKTTTTHMVKTILEAAGKKTGMIGTNGVMIGTDHYPTVNTTPESYDLHRYFAQMTEAGCECCVMEVSSQAMKMHRVTGIVFDCAVFTNISPDHIGPDEHADFAEYLFYKKQLFTQSRRAFVNLDDEHFQEIIKDIPCPWTGFGLMENQKDCPRAEDSSEKNHTGSDYLAEHIEYVSEPDFVGTGFDIRGEHEIPVRVSIPGKFNVYNALAAAAVTLWCGVPKRASSACHGAFENQWTHGDCTYFPAVLRDCGLCTQCSQHGKPSVHFAGLSSQTSGGCVWLRRKPFQGSPVFYGRDWRKNGRSFYYYSR